MPEDRIKLKIGGFERPLDDFRFHASRATGQNSYPDGTLSFDTFDCTYIYDEEANGKLDVYAKFTDADHWIKGSVDFHRTKDKSGSPSASFQFGGAKITSYRETWGGSDDIKIEITISALNIKYQKGKPYKAGWSNVKDVKETI